MEGGRCLFTWDKYCGRDTRIQPEAERGTGDVLGRLDSLYEKIILLL